MQIIGFVIVAVRLISMSNEKKIRQMKTSQLIWFATRGLSLSVSEADKNFIVSSPSTDWFARVMLRFGVNKKQLKKLNKKNISEKFLKHILLGLFRSTMKNHIIHK